VTEEAAPPPTEAHATAPPPTEAHATDPSPATEAHATDPSPAAEAPAAATPPPPPPPPPPASEPVQGLSLVGSVIAGRVKRNPRPLLAALGVFLFLWFMRRLMRR
jgi:hypothetical protein